jgi:hypothetical protein
VFEREERERQVTIAAKLKAKEDALKLQRELGMMQDEDEEEEEVDKEQEGKLYYDNLFAENVMCVTYKRNRVFKTPQLMEVYYKRKMTKEEIERNRALRRELRDKCVYEAYRIGVNTVEEEEVEEGEKKGGGEEEEEERRSRKEL